MKEKKQKELAGALLGIIKLACRKAMVVKEVELDSYWTEIGEDVPEKMLGIKLR